MTRADGKDDQLSTDILMVENKDTWKIEEVK